MQISSRFTEAVHLLACIGTFQTSRRVTSDFLAQSVNVHPVVIRRLLSQLKAAGIVRVARGTGGASLARPAQTVTLLDIYRAVDCVQGDLFRFHENPNPDCPVGSTIHAALDGRLRQIQSAMEEEMSRITLSHILHDTRSKPTS